MDRFGTYPDDWRVKLCGAYLITHRATGRVYVGSTGNLYIRRIDHLSDLRHNQHCNALLQQAFNENSFVEFSAIVTGDEAEAVRIEQDVLNRYMGSGCLFNLSPDAAVSFKGLRHSDETKSRISQAKIGMGLGVPKTPEHREKIGLANKGRKPAPQTTAAVVAAKSRSVSVDGVIYSSLAEVARAFEITSSSVHDRIKSTSERFKNWIYA